MRTRPWYKRYPSDFLHGTAGLSLEVKGAYSVVLDLIYDRRGPIPDDARWIAGHCGCSTRQWNKIRAVLLEAGKLCKADGYLTNQRAVEELQIAEEAAKKLAESGAKGGTKSAETRRKIAENEGDINKINEIDEAPLQAALKHTRAVQKLDIRLPPISPDGGLPSHEDFFAFKGAYPKREGAQDWTKARERFARIVKAGTDPQILIGAARAYKAETDRTNNTGTRFVKQAATFLTSVWRDYAGTPEATAKTSRPTGWPSNLPPMENVKNAWATGHWPGNWGSEPGNPDCRVPPAILAQWAAERVETGGAA